MDGSLLCAHLMSSKTSKRRRGCSTSQQPALSSTFISRVPSQLTKATSRTFPPVCRDSWKPSRQLFSPARSYQKIANNDKFGDYGNVTIFLPRRTRRARRFFYDIIFVLFVFFVVKKWSHYVHTTILRWVQRYVPGQL